MRNLATLGPVCYSYPVFSVYILVGIPLACEEGMLFADDFPVEEGDHLGVLVRQVLDLEVATQVGVLLVHVLHHETNYRRQKTETSPSEKHRDLFNTFLDPELILPDPDTIFRVPDPDSTHVISVGRYRYRYIWKLRYYFFKLSAIFYFTLQSYSTVPVLQYCTGQKMQA